MALIGVGCAAQQVWLAEELAWRGVFLAFDADAAGDEASVRWESTLRFGTDVVRLRPEGVKDWNEVLMHDASALRTCVAYARSIPRIARITGSAPPAQTPPAGDLSQDEDAPPSRPCQECGSPAIPGTHYCRECVPGSPERILLDLLEAEPAERTTRSVRYRLGLARFAVSKDVDSFEFASPPVCEQQVGSLYQDGFLSTHSDLLSIGGIGTGKTHLSIAIAHSLIRHGQRGRFFNVVDLVNQLEQEKLPGRGGKLAKSLARAGSRSPG